MAKTTRAVAVFLGDRSRGGGDLDRSATIQGRNRRHGSVSGRDPARRHARRLAPVRAHDLQPLCRSVGGGRADLAPHAGAARARQPDDGHARAVARRELVGVRQTAGPTPSSCATGSRSPTAPRSPRPTCCSRFAALYDPQSQFGAGLRHVRGRQAARGRSARPAHGRASARRRRSRRWPAPVRRHPDAARSTSCRRRSIAAHSGTRGGSIHRPPRLAGLGPFVLTEHVSGQRLVFSRNPRYWRKDAAGAPLPYLDTLTVLLLGDQNTEAAPDAERRPRPDGQWRYPP